MACDKGSRINSALQTKQGSRGQVKQSSGFALTQPTGLAQPLGRPVSHRILESPLVAFLPYTTEGQMDVCNRSSRYGQPHFLS